MYCINCGEQLPDGSAFCPMCGAAVTGEADYIPNPNGAPQDASQSYPQQNPQYYPQQPPQPRQTVAQNVQAAAAAMQSSSVFKHLKELLIQLFKDPAAALKSAYSSGDRIAQFCIGGTTLVMWFLCCLTFLLKSWSGNAAASAFGHSILVMLIAAAAMAASAGCYYLFSDKKRSFLDVCALVGASSLYSAVWLAIMLLCLLIGVMSTPTLLRFLVIMLPVINTAAACYVAQVVCAEKKSFYLVLGLLAVLLLIILLLPVSKYVLWAI